MLETWKFGNMKIQRKWKRKYRPI